MDSKNSKTQGFKRDSRRKFPQGEDSYRKRGFFAENQSCRFLESKKFRIIETNFYSRFGEIDIIALKDNVLHFIEVKSGKNFEPIFNITPRKLERLSRTIAIYQQKNPNKLPYCIDALIVKYGDNGLSFELVGNITRF